MSKLHCRSECARAGNVSFCSRGVRPPIFFPAGYADRKDRIIIASTMNGSNGWTTVTKSLRRSRKDGPAPQEPVAAADAITTLDVRKAWPTPQQGATKTVEVDQTAERKSVERRHSDASDGSMPALLDEYTSDESSGDQQLRGHMSSSPTAPPTPRPRAKATPRPSSRLKSRIVWEESFLRRTVTILARYVLALGAMYTVPTQ